MLEEYTAEDLTDMTDAGEKWQEVDWGMRRKRIVSGALCDPPSVSIDSSPGGAFRLRAEDHTKLELGASKFRFVVPTLSTTPATVYALSWLERLIPADPQANQEILHAASVKFVGTGESIYIGKEADAESGAVGQYGELSWEDAEDDFLILPPSLELGDGQIAVFALKVDLTFADPESESWEELPEAKIVLSDQELRIRARVYPKFDTLEQITDIDGLDKVKVATSATNPAGVDIPIDATTTTLEQGTDYSELRIAQTRDQLKTLGLLPSSEEDGINEKAWFDTGDSSPTASSNLRDGQAFDAGMPQDSRGQSTKYGDLTSSPPNSPLHKTFIQAAGVEIVTALIELGDTESPRRQIMNQSDFLYYSGHGSSQGHLSPGNGVPDVLYTDVDPYWDGNDIKVFIVGGCAILDINNYNGNPTYIPGAGQLYPGEYWEQTGPETLLGYNYLAPNDLQNSDTIVTSWATNRGTLGDIDAWEQANDNSNGRNACAIETGVAYYYFKKLFPLVYVWETVPKSSW